MDNTGMTGLVRCKCAKLPEVKIEDKGQDYTVILRCAEHGWVAQGDTLEQAKDHWNTFANYMLSQAA